MLKILKNKTTKRFFAFLLCFLFLGIVKVTPVKAYAGTTPSVRIESVANAKPYNNGFEDTWRLSNYQTTYTGQTYNLTTNNAYINYVTNAGADGAFQSSCVYIDGNYVANTDGYTYDKIKSNQIDFYSMKGDSSDYSIVETRFIVKNLKPGTHRIQIRSNILEEGENGTFNMNIYSDAIYVNVQ